MKNPVKEAQFVTAEHAPRCTNAAVEAITGRMPDHLLIYGTSVLEELDRQGYEVEWMLRHGYRTLRALMRDMPEGTYYLASAGHAMALVDGVLTDTEAKGFNLRRIQLMFRVTKKEEAS